MDGVDSMAASYQSMAAEMDPCQYHQKQIASLQSQISVPLSYLMLNYVKVLLKASSCSQLYPRVGKFPDPTYSTRFIRPDLYCLKLQLSPPSYMSIISILYIVHIRNVAVLDSCRKISIKVTM
jgi:hypothetical protein